MFRTLSLSLFFFFGIETLHSDFQVHTSWAKHHGFLLQCVSRGLFLLRWKIYLNICLFVCFPPGEKSFLSWCSLPRPFSFGSVSIIWPVSLGISLLQAEGPSQKVLLHPETSLLWSQTPMRQLPKAPEQWQHRQHLWSLCLEIPTERLHLPWCWQCGVTAWVTWPSSLTALCKPALIWRYVMGLAWV